MTPEDRHSSIAIVLIDELARQLVKNYVPGYLMNRERLGIPLHKQLAYVLLSMEEDTLAVDFSGIEEMTTSVAEEIGPRLVEEFLRQRDGGRDVYLVYCNVSEDIARGLHGSMMDWLTRHPHYSRRFTTVAFHNRHDSQFVGHRFMGGEIPGALSEVLNVIYQLGEASSSRLQDHGIKAASRKLNALVNQYPWLVRKAQVALDADPRSWAYVYSPVVPTVSEPEVV